jgi:hypothetical protein
MIIPFQTTNHQLKALNTILFRMKIDGIQEQFLNQIKLRLLDQGIYDLVQLWFFEGDFLEREKILGDIQNSIDDYEVSNNSMN